MPSKKRSAPALYGSNSAKHRKTQQTSLLTMSQPDAAADSLTEQNAKQSRLLSLPKELRLKIWAYAFGEMEVVLQSRWAPRGQLINISDNTSTVQRRRRVEVPLPVCRQFWNEASEVFYKTCQFVFLDPRAFRLFAHSNYGVVPHVHRITVELEDVNLASHFPWGWRNAFTSSIVGLFERLEGVVFRGPILYFFHTPPDGAPDLMHDRWFKVLAMPQMIRAFTQHKLKPRLTSVNFSVHWPDSEPDFGSTSGWDGAVLNKALRDDLLKHRPQRRSKR